MARTARIARKTKETDIEVEINLDGVGNQDISTGIGFLDHMFSAMSKHGRFDLVLRSADVARLARPLANRQSARCQLQIFQEHH